MLYARLPVSPVGWGLSLYPPRPRRLSRGRVARLAGVVGTGDGAPPRGRASPWWCPPASRYTYLLPSSPTSEDNVPRCTRLRTASLLIPSTWAASLSVTLRVRPTVTPTFAPTSRGTAYPYRAPRKPGDGTSRVHYAESLHIAYEGAPRPGEKGRKRPNAVRRVGPQETGITQAGAQATTPCRDHHEHQPMCRRPLETWLSSNTCLSASLARSAPRLRAFFSAAPNG